MAKQQTWSQLVKKLGVDRARIEAPELDPKYKELIKQEGQAAGSQTYAQKYIDPQTERASSGLSADIKAGIPVEESGTGLLGIPGKIEGHIGQAEGAIGTAFTGGTGPLGSFGPKPTPPDPTKGGGGKTTTTTGAQPNPFQTAETQLFNSLVGQYQGEMNIVNPYISGANAAQYATSAQNVGNAFAGGGVQAQNPTTAGIISKDAAAYAAANTAGQQGVQNAIGAQGPANAAALQASPYQSILAALQSEAQYKTETGAGTPALATGSTAPNPVTDPYGAAVALASESAGTGTAPGATTVQNANASVPAANVSTPTTNTSGSTGQAGGS
jgi:hypothetical protein